MRWFTLPADLNKSTLSTFRHFRNVEVPASATRFVDHPASGDSSVGTEGRQVNTAVRLLGQSNHGTVEHGTGRDLQRFERSVAMERLERLERLDPGKSAAIERLEHL